MVQKSNFILWLNLVCFSVFAQQDSWVLTPEVHNGSSDMIYGLEMDSEGALYTMRKEVVYSPYYVSDYIYIDKYDTAGNTIWSNFFYSLGSPMIGGCFAKDDDDRFYVVGTIYNELIHFYATPGGNDIFYLPEQCFPSCLTVLVAVYDGEGALLSYKGFIVDGFPVIDFTTVFIDHDKNLILGGKIVFSLEDVILGNDTLPGTNVTEVTDFIVKLDPNLDILWVQNMGTKEFPYHYQKVPIALDESGNIFIADSFEDSLQLDQTMLYADGYGGYVARLDPDGNLDWVSQVSNTSEVSIARGICYTPDGKLLTSFAAPGSAYSDFEVKWNDSIVDVDNGFLAEINPEDGSLVWIKQAGLYSYTALNDGLIQVDETGSIYMSGIHKWFSASNDYETEFCPDIPLNDTSYGKYYSYVVKYDSVGNYQCGNVISEADGFNRYDFFVDHSGDFYMTGDYEDKIEFPNSTFETDENQETYVARVEWPYCPELFVADVVDSVMTPGNSFDLEYSEWGDFYDNNLLTAYLFDETCDSVYKIGEAISTGSGYLPVILPQDIDTALIYSLKVFSSFPAVISTSDSLGIPVTTSFESENILNVSLFPNPAGDFFMLEANTDHQVQLTISNSLGRIFHECSFVKEISLSTAQWPNGSYFITLRDQSRDQVSIKKLHILHE